MNGDRYVLLGLAQPRAEWFRSVARWATSAALPAEFLKCVSAEELRARLASGRPVSAVLLDGGLASVDRDLLDGARAAGAAPIVIDSGLARRDWNELGAVAVLPATFGPEVLLDALVSHATMLRRGQLQAVADDDTATTPAGWRAPVAVVCGPGGTGASTAAAALAQGLATRPELRGGGVLLADLCLHGEQAVLHDVHDVAPGVQELTEAHRGRRPSDDEVRAVTFVVEDRGYRLLLGLRRARYWPTLRPRAFEAAFASMREVFGAVVCDVTGDFEGEPDCGSVDVEERNMLARVAAAAADVVFAVGLPGVKGVHSLARLLGDLATFDVPTARLQPVINAAPRSPRERAALSSTVAQIAGAATGGAELASPVFLPRRRVDDAIRDGVPLPSPLPALMAGAYDAVMTRTAGRQEHGVGRAPVLLAPGTLGHWSDDGGDHHDGDDRHGDHDDDGFEEAAG